MIKLGTSNITSIYKGTEEIIKAYKGLDLVFNKTTPEPVAEYITDGLFMDFRGEDNYANGAWTSRINTASKTYAFTPVSNDTAPIHNSSNKLYEATSFGGMVGNFTIDSIFSFEITLRDVKNVESKSNTTTATILGSNANSSVMYNGIVLFKNTSANTLTMATRTSSGGVYSSAKIDCATLVDGGLDTFTFIPNAGFFHNGVKISNCSASIATGQLALFTNFNYSAYSAKGKVHAVRYYTRILTEEEVKHNYETDISIYGE